VSAAATVETDLAGRRRPRLLLAEDDVELRSLLALALRRDGFDVVEAHDGFQLLDFMGMALIEGERVRPVDLIVSDLCMPGWNGLQILAGVRAAQWAVPVILISAFADQRAHQQARRLDATLIDKPFDLGQLRTLAREVVAAAQPA
jgi:DNA-binding response OmpR family regulator